jgi:hypothetical protein
MQFWPLLGSCYKTLFQLYNLLYVWKLLCITLLYNRNLLCITLIHNSKLWYNRQTCDLTVMLCDITGGIWGCHTHVMRWDLHLSRQDVWLVWALPCSPQRPYLRVWIGWLPCWWNDRSDCMMDSWQNGQLQPGKWQSTSTRLSGLGLAAHVADIACYTVHGQIRVHFKLQAKAEPEH